MAKKSTYERLLETLDRLENYKYVGDTMNKLSWCSDTITWLWKWRKITKEEMESLCNRVIVLFECYN